MMRLRVGASPCISLNDQLINWSCQQMKRYSNTETQRRGLEKMERVAVLVGSRMP